MTQETQETSIQAALRTMTEIIGLQQRLIESLGRAVKIHHNVFALLADAGPNQQIDMKPSEAALAEVEELKRLHKLGTNTAEQN